MKIMMSAIVGMIAGMLANCLSRYLIQNRINAPIHPRIIYGRYSLLGWAIAFSAAYALISLVINSTLFAVECMVLFFICGCISVIDGFVQKIPNELLLALLLSKTIFLCIDYQRISLINNLNGFALALVLFMISSYFGIQIEWGYIKYAAVIGFCLSVNGFLQTVIIMTAGLGIYAVYLLTTKKGCLKTPFPIGPCISIGVLLTALYPLL